MMSFILFLSLLTTILAFIGFDMITHYSNIINFIGAVALGIGIFLTFKPKKKAISLDLDDNENNQLLQENYQKAVADYEYLQKSLKQINDVELKNQLQKMQKTSANILHYLQKNPKKISLARRFIDYYQDTTAKLVAKYIELEYTQLHTANVNAIKQRTKNTLIGLDNAYTEQFEKLISDQLLDMDAELKVMETTIKADGYEFKPENKSKIKTVQPDINRCRMRHRYVINNVYNQLKDFPHKFFTNDDAIWQKKLIAGGLGILFGGFGAHKFYLGKTFMGVFYLLFSWTGIPFIAGFIEGIRYLFMSKDEFYRKFF